MEDLELECWIPRGAGLLILYRRRKVAGAKLILVYVEVSFCKLPAE